MNPETHLFILWERARAKEAEILNDIKKSFTLLKEYDITWTQEYVSSNFTRFYGQNLPSHSEKEMECGTGSFLLCVVRDENPRYEVRMTSHGLEEVNVNLFDKKSLYRDWTGGGHKIHCTTNTKETNHDLTLLIGRNVWDFEKEVTSPEREHLNKDIEGAAGWESLEQLFYVLNNTVNYVILRGSMEPSIVPYAYLDTDALTTDYENFKLIVNGTPALSEDRPKSELHIQGKLYYLDVWDVRRNYYDLRWVSMMLDTSVMDGYLRVLNAENDFYCLLYHCLTNKGSIADKYTKKFETYRKQFGIKEEDWNKVLVDWLAAHNYDIPQHTDRSNPFNIANPIINKYATRYGVCIRMVDDNSYDVRTKLPLNWESRVYKKDNSFVKKGTPWLIENEKRILENVQISFMPSVLRDGKEGDYSWIEIATMQGEKINAYFAKRKNFTIRGIKQFVKAGVLHLQELYKAGIIHRDITMDNMLIYQKDGLCDCNLIDFGSAILYQTDKNFPCPQFLGDSYAPEYMYSDFYNFGQLIITICRKMPYLQHISAELMTIQWDTYQDVEQMDNMIYRVLALCDRRLSMRDCICFYKKKYAYLRKKYWFHPKRLLRRILKKSV